MNLAPSFICVGCAQKLTVATTEPVDPITCPSEGCGRIVWIVEGKGLELLTDRAPDLSDRFGRDCGRLLDRGAELLLGPPEALDQIADLLNARPPASDFDLVSSVLALVQAYGRAGRFKVGAQLRLAGSRARAS